MKGFITPYKIVGYIMSFLIGAITTIAFLSNEITIGVLSCALFVLRLAQILTLSNNDIVKTDNEEKE